MNNNVQPTQPAMVNSTQPAMVKSTQPVMVNSTPVPEPSDNDNLYATVTSTPATPYQASVVAPSQASVVAPSQASKPIKMLNFNTSWCGWSKKFQPEWDNFTANVKSDNKLNSLVEVLDVKCDNDANKKLCMEHNVEGYPTVSIEANGQMSHYEGQRTSDELMKKLKQTISNLPNTVEKFTNSTGSICMTDSNCASNKCDYMRCN